jgi:2-iminobutanoate/2-iminopropanoate deaminase
VRIDRRHEVREVPPPTGPFAVSARHGDLVFVSGLRGIDAGTGKPVPGTRERLRLIFSYLESILRANGSSLRCVLSTRVYVTDMKRHRPMVNDAFRRFFGADLPTRTIVEVRALNQSDAVELEAIAVRRKRPAR